MLRPAFDAPGEGAGVYLQGLEGAQPRNTAHHARKILGLRERLCRVELADYGHRKHQDRPS